MSTLSFPQDCTRPYQSNSDAFNADGGERSPLKHDFVYDGKQGETNKHVPPTSFHVNQRNGSTESLESMDPSALCDHSALTNTVSTSASTLDCDVTDMEMEESSSGLGEEHSCDVTERSIKKDMNMSGVDFTPSRGPLSTPVCYSITSTVASRGAVKAFGSPPGVMPENAWSSPLNFESGALMKHKMLQTPQRIASDGKMNSFFLMTRPFIATPKKIEPSPTQEDAITTQATPSVTPKSVHFAPLIHKELTIPMSTSFITLSPSAPKRENFSCTPVKSLPEPVLSQGAVDPKPVGSISSRSKRKCAVMASKSIAAQADAEKTTAKSEVEATTNGFAKNEKPAVLTVAYKSRETATPSAGLSCRCPRTACIKLYCVCFQVKEFCNDSCGCKGCKNTLEHDGPNGARTEAIIVFKRRWPEGFVPKVRTANPTCACTKSRCLKKYCNCYGNGNTCLETCTCNDCRNYGKKYPKVPLKTVKKGKKKQNSAPSAIDLVKVPKM